MDVESIVTRITLTEPPVAHACSRVNTLSSATPRFGSEPLAAAIGDAGETRRVMRR